MNRVVASFALVVALSTLGVIGYAQGDKNGSASTIPAVSITPETSPIDLAKAALVAQGGDKYKNLKSMVLIGSVELYAPNSTQSIPGKFVIAIAGDKMLVDIDARPAVSFKDIYDGQQSYSSLPGVNLPPASKSSPWVLTKLDQPGYKVTAIPDKKKQRGFRVADAEGNTTDFFLDSATGRIVTFLTPFNGYTFGTENKKQQEVDGVLVPMSFSQRLEMPQGAFFAEYKVKDVKLNQTLGDDVFAIPH